MRVVAIGLCVAGPGLVGFYIAQRRLGHRLLQSVLSRLVGDGAWRGVGAVDAIYARLGDFHARPPMHGATREHLSEIVDIQLANVGKLLKDRKLRLEVSPAAKDVIINEGYDPQYGARPMRRSVERFLEDPLAEELLRGQFHEGEPIRVTADKDKLVFSQNASATGALSS